MPKSKTDPWSVKASFHKVQEETSSDYGSQTFDDFIVQLSFIF